MISEEIVTRVAARLAEHVRTHALPSVHVILHGGEPLLAGPTRLRRICVVLREALAGIDLDLRIHTNAVQLSERYLDLFAEFDVKVGVSLDGDRIANDRHRRYANGRSSHQQVLDALGLLRLDRYRHLYAGLLCTVDIANDPVAVYDALADLAPPRIDFLLPHATWDEPPVRPASRPAAYAEWLLRIFDRWDATGQPMPVRLFDSVISTCRGGPSLTESMGVGPSDLLVIETDGTLEQADSLKIAYDGAPETGFDVFSHSFDTVAGHPGMVARQQGVAGLSAECRACPVVRSCGGGLYAHRYRSANGFDNPSVYCADLKALVTGVSSRLGAKPDLERESSRSVPGMDRLAGGSDDLEPLLGLAAAQRSVTRGWLAVIDERITDRTGELFETAQQLLFQLEEHPDAMELLLAHPYLRGWAADRLAARSGRGGLPSIAPLIALAASAALRAGRPGPVPVPAGSDGTVFLPGIGRVRMTPTDALMAEAVADGDTIVVRLAGDEACVVPGAAPDARWQPVGRLADGVVLDDLDAYRDCYARPARERLSVSETDRFRDTMESAWHLLRDAVPSRLPGLTAVLTTVTPLAGTPDADVDVRLAGGIRGMGAVGLTSTDDPATLARELLQGHQLATLDALVEQAELYDEFSPWSFTVPWTRSPLLAGEVLAQAYVRSATTALAADPGRHAEETLHVLDALKEADVLSSAGEEFVAGIRTGIEGEA